MELDEKKYLYLLFILPILVVIFLYNLYWKRKKQREFGDVELVKRLTPEKSVFKSVLKFVILLLAFACFIIALVNPKIGTKTETVKREGIDIVFAVDVSKSMLAEDIAPNRLDKTKQIISQVINELGNDRIGVVAYAGSAFPVLPLTTDYGVAKMFVQSMNPGMVSSQGTSLEEAIKMSESYFDEKSKTSKLVILISDGEDHSEGAKATAEEANKAGLKILTIGVGTAKGGPIPLKRNGVVESFQRDRQNEVVITKLNESSLQEIAKATKGKYINGSNTKEVVDFVKKALENIEKTEFESTQFTDFNSQFQWFLGFGMLLLFVDIFLLEKKTGWVKKMNLFNEEKLKTNVMTYKNIVVILAILFSLVVKGQEKDKNLPEGNEAFNEKNYIDAETNYRISASKFPKKADSYYNLGNTIYTINQPAEAKFAYQNAIKNATTRPEKHKAFHNLGNVLMKEKNYEGAVNIYRQALINNPSDDETRYNYALAKKMLKENPPKDEKKNDKEKDEKKEQDKKEKEDKKDGDKDKKDNKGDKDKDKKDEGKNEKDDKGDGKKPKEGQISQQRIQNLLDAVNNDEKRVQEKVNAQKVKGKPVETDKDW